MSPSAAPAAGQTALGTALARLAAADPDRPALTDESGTLSRAELEARSNRLARAFEARGVTPGSMVSIALSNTAQFVESVIATWKLGAIPQPLSHRLPAAELAAILELAQPSLLVGLEPVAGVAHVAAGFEPDASLSAGELPARIAPSWKAPTSGGTSGRPKLIVSTTPAVAELVGAQASLLRCVPDGVQLVTGPLYHNGPFAFAMGSMLLGYHVVLMRRFDPAQALALIEKHRVDWMYAVPTMMSRIWKLPETERERHDLSSLRTVFHMAAPCPSWLKQAWIDWMGPDCVWELYGGTEGTCTTIIGGADWLAHRGSVGRPIAGELRILDPDGNEVGPRTVGEVYMRPAGGRPTYRYFGAEPRRSGDWESLGDHGWLDEEGYLHLTGRDGEVVLVGGASMYPAEIEAALTEHPVVEEACVVGLPDDDLGNRLHAVVRVSGAIDDEELRRHLAARLDPHKIPRTFQHSDAPIRDAADKVRRSLVRATALEQESESTASRA